MLIWFILFFIVLGISFFLAYRSMIDFVEKPTKLSGDYSLFLIQNPVGLTENFFTALYELTSAKSLPVSFEKLFRGSRQALVVFGPKDILTKFKDELKLLELEDYTLKVKEEEVKNSETIIAWEVGLRHKVDSLAGINPIQTYVPTDLEDTEQVWWQLILTATSNSLKEKPSFAGLIRVVVLAQTSERSQEIQHNLSLVGHEKQLSPLPQAFSKIAMFKFYKERAISATTNPKGINLQLESSEIKVLLGI